MARAALAAAAAFCALVGAAARAQDPAPGPVAQLGLDRLVPGGLGRERPPPPPIQGGVPFAVRFAGAARGLERGAAVEVGGVRVGAVRGVALDYEAEANRVVVLVDIEVQPDLLPAVGGRRARTAEEATAALDALVRAGMRARVGGTGPLGRGETVVALEIAGGASPTTGLLRAGSTAAPEIPSAPSRGEEAEERLRELLDRLSRAPVEAMIADLQAAMAALRTAATGPELRDALAGLRDGAAELRAQVRRIGDRADSVLAAGGDTVRGATRTLERAVQTLATAERQIGDRSPLVLELNTAVRELSGAARAMRLMADYLERNPEALIRGKSDNRR